MTVGKGDRVCIDEGVNQEIDASIANEGFRMRERILGAYTP